MLSTPFRSPLLKRHHSEDENGQHQSKKTKIFEAAGPRLIFKNPGVSSLPRKPLLEVTNKAGDPNPGASKGYYNVLWRHRSGKKHKTWEGDALCVVSDGHAELLDRDTGKSIGRTKCNQPLLPGSTLLLSGKDIEVDSVLSTSQYVEWKHSLAAKKPKEIRPPEHKKATETKVVKTQVKSTKPTAKIKQSPTTLPPDVPSAAATGQGRGDVPRSQNTRTTELLPRHSPHAPGAIVMKRPLDNKVDVVIDPLLSGKLREHQRDGVKFMYECVMGLRDYDGQGAILADEMGLGKTLQTIALLWTLLKQSPYGSGSVIKKALIVCPATLISNWKKEFRKWLGSDRIGVLVAEGNFRVRDFTHGKSYSIMIVGYEKLRNIQTELLKGQGVDIIVADEAHRLKTAKNKSAQAIKSLPTERRIFLSGTPLQNDLSEFYILVDTVNPGVLSTSKSFTRDFEIPINRGRQPGASLEAVEEGEDCNRELARLISPFILRRTIDVLAKYLPAKTEHVLFCTPTEAQKTVYRHITTSPTFRAATQGKSECSLQLITLLKKACNSPSLLNPKTQEAMPGKVSSSASMLAEIPPHLLSNNAGSTKLRMLDTLLHTIRTTTSEKVVLVSHYTSTLDLLGNLLSSMGHTFNRVDGSTPSGKRQGIIDSFNGSSADACFAFLLSAKAGGLGINLVAASRLVLFDVDWNPSLDLQSMARIHRDGQKRNCFIYRFLMAGGIDEKIWQRQIVKLGLANSVVDQGVEGSSFTREDLMDLFRLEEGSKCQTHELIGCSCAGSGTDFVDIDDYDGGEDLPSIPTFVKASTVDGEQQMEKTKKAAHAARDALMAYTHIDTSSFAADGGNEDHEDPLIKDEVLMKTLMDEGNRISYVFSKTSA